MPIFFYVFFFCFFHSLFTCLQTKRQCGITKVKTRKYQNKYIYWSIRIVLFDLVRFSIFLSLSASAVSCLLSFNPFLCHSHSVFLSVSHFTNIHHITTHNLPRIRKYIHIWIHNAVKRQQQPTIARERKYVCWLPVDVSPSFSRASEYAYQYMYVFANPWQFTIVSVM